MRDIKFRVWNVKDKEMMDWLLLRQTAFNRSSAPDQYGVMYQVFTASDEQYILMQFTGLKDKNGKEIYEGDILAGDFPNLLVGYCHDTASFGASKTNEFDIQNMYWFHHDIDLFIDHWEVIGNIHEHAHLLTNHPA